MPSKTQKHIMREPPNTDENYMEVQEEEIKDTTVANLR